METPNPPLSSEDGGGKSNVGVLSPIFKSDDAVGADWELFPAIKPAPTSSDKPTSLSWVIPSAFCCLSKHDRKK